MLTDLRKRIYDRLAALPKGPDRYSMIHADLHSSNFLVTHSGVAAIDFDDAGLGWHHYELAVALESYVQDPDYASFQEAMLTGYRSKRPFAESDAELLPLFRLIRVLALLGWHYLRPEIKFNTQSWMRYIRMLARQYD